MKCRFIKEYARYQQIQILAADNFTDHEKTVRVRMVNNALYGFERGVFAVNDVMRTIYDAGNFFYTVPAYLMQA